MWPFKREHKHKVDTSLSKRKMAASLITGVPIQVSYTRFCKCGFVMERDISPAGYQQLQWGADYESLFDDGPIRPAEGKEEVVKAQQEAFNKHYCFTSK